MLFYGIRHMEGPAGNILETAQAVLLLQPRVYQECLSRIFDADCCITDLLDFH